LETALRATLNSFQSSFPICDEGELAGMLPYSILVKSLEKQNLQTPIRQVMQKGILPVKPQDKLIDVQKRMTLERLDSIPVADESGFLGMITSQDLNEAYRLNLALDKSGFAISWKPTT
jgi:CBS domain-containing protein